MAVLEVLKYPNEYLRRAAEPVRVFDDALRKLVADMNDTMAAEDGLGLAATQVGVGTQVLVVHPVAFRGDEARDEPTVVLVNPQIVWESPEKILAEEGCLSFPGVFIPVTRPARVRISALDADGRPFEVEGEGLGARALLHEIDHLRGVVMIDHVSFLQKQRALKKHERNQAEAAPRLKRGGRTEKA
ncbi:MAG: peptide deformylase [Bradymonadia bacterium]|jgi:peptide deformylase